MTQIPSTQYAIQIVGKEEFVVNPAKPVDPVGPTQILLEVEACGICFSDTKLLHQFDGHPRKSDVVGGIDMDALKDISSYHPNQEAVTPGHEPVVRVVQVGEKVTHYKVGDRLLVQADWKHLRTAKSNGAFGYNFDGALQEYTGVDERRAGTSRGACPRACSSPRRAFSADPLSKEDRCGPEPNPSDFSRHNPRGRASPVLSSRYC